jgi:hypothetical protein
MKIRGSSVFFVSVAAGVLALALIFAHASFRSGTDRIHREETREMVRHLGITDLCLFTDARYSRHPSVADRFTPFQEHPFALEHFPSGSILSPPPHLGRRGR